MLRECIIIITQCVGIVVDVVLVVIPKASFMQFIKFATSSLMKLMRSQNARIYNAKRQKRPRHQCIPFMSALYLKSQTFPPNAN